MKHNITEYTKLTNHIFRTKFGRKTNFPIGDNFDEFCEMAGSTEYMDEVYACSLVNPGTKTVYGLLFNLDTMQELTKREVKKVIVHELCHIVHTLEGIDSTDHDKRFQRINRRYGGSWNYA